MKIIQMLWNSELATEEKQAIDNLITSLEKENKRLKSDIEACKDFIKSKESGEPFRLVEIPISFDEASEAYGRRIEAIAIKPTSRREPCKSCGIIVAMQIAGIFDGEPFDVNYCMNCGRKL